MGRSVSAIAVGSSSRSVNVLLPTTLKVTSPTGSSMAGGGLEVAASSSTVAAGYCSEAPTGILLAPILSSAEGPSGGN